MNFVQLRHICELNYGKALRADKRDEGIFPVYGSAGIIGYNSEYLVKGPGIIVGRKGNVGSVFFEAKDFYPIDTVYYLHLKDKSKCDLKYIYYSLLTSNLKSLNTDSAVPGLNRNVALEQLISLPPLPTQKKIASILSAFDNLIENNLKRIKLLEESAELLYRELFATGTKKETLCNIYNTNSGSTPPRTNAKYFSGKINWFKTRELNDSVLFKSEERITQEAVSRVNLKIQSPGAVLIAMYGATIGRLGILSEASTTNQACCTITSKNDVYPLIYIFQWLKANKEFILNLRMGAAQQNISQEIVRNLEVDIPNDLVSLKEYALRIENCYAAIKNYMAQNIILANSRDLLLPKLMSGEIKV